MYNSQNGIKIETNDGQGHCDTDCNIYIDFNQKFSCLLSCYQDCIPTTTVTTTLTTTTLNPTDQCHNNCDITCQEWDLKHL